MRYFYEYDKLDGSTGEIEITEEQFDSNMMDVLRKSRGFVPFIRVNETDTFEREPSYHW